MRTRFGKPKTQMIDKYHGQADPHTHLAKWTHAYGEKTQPKWLHLFYHTVDIVPMNWYVETELRYAIGEWDILHKGFMTALSFEDGFDSIDEALQEVKVAILRILHDPLDLI